jgi:AhpD family alkylhydroperoxidase
MSLTIKEKELVNIGASVATGCKPCTDYHFKELQQTGASDDEIRQAISDALSVRDSAKEVMESHGLRHLGIEKELDERDSTEGTTRIRELVSVAAAFAVNCTSNLQRHIAAARTVGITEDEIGSVLDAAVFIKGEAAHYVDQIVRLKEENIQLQQLLQELQETQAQLVQSEKMASLGKLVAGVVHEMNTPVGAISSAADVSTRSINNILEVLESSQTLDEVKKNRRLQGSLKALQDNLPVTMAASERITRIVNSLKGFANLDESVFQRTDLHEGLEDTLTLIEHDLGDRIDVVRDYGEIPPVEGHPAELNQVFMNLLTNAVHAIKGKGTISILTYADGENIHVEIADTGVGISPAHQQTLFDPVFSRGKSRVKAGLGLFTSYNIVRKHQGQIRVDSEAGRGSTFTVILPREPEKPLSAHDSTGSGDDGSRCARLKARGE